jgi:hypothetical protein
MRAVWRDVVVVVVVMGRFWELDNTRRWSPTDGLPARQFWRFRGIAAI